MPQSQALVLPRQITKLLREAPPRALLWGINERGVPAQAPALVRAPRGADPYSRRCVPDDVIAVILRRTFPATNGRSLTPSRIFEVITDDHVHTTPRGVVRQPATAQVQSPGSIGHRPPRCDVVHRPSASPTTSGGSGQSSVSQMARSSSTSRTVTCWFARMQDAQATTIRRLMAGTD
jgi:hypothetical protein